MASKESRFGDCKVFTCNYEGCLQAFSRQSRLERHIRTHTGERPFACEFPGCLKSYSRADHLKRHVALHPTADESDIETSYGGVSQTYSEQDTEASKSPNKPHIFRKRNRLCIESSSEDNSDQPTEKYIRKELPKYLCKELGCGAVFFKKHKLRSHLLLHEGMTNSTQRFFECKFEDCDAMFTSKASLNRHSKTHKGYSCNKSGCGQTFSKFSLLKKHFRIHHKHKVTHQDQMKTTASPKSSTSRNISKSKETTSTTHAVLTKPISAAAGSAVISKELRVELTDILQSKDVYKYLSPKCSSETKDDPPFEPELERLDSPRSRCSSKAEHMCYHEGCAMVFSRPSRLECHLRTHTGERPFKCEIEGCTSSYTRAAHLKRHQDKNHASLDDSGVILHSCPDTTCDKTFSLEHNMKKHYRIAHEVSGLKYRCSQPECDEVFRKKKQLRAHLLAHAGTPQLRCPHEDCGRSFNTKTRLHRHMKSHQEGYRCDEEDCKFKFDKYSLLRKHIAATHKAWVKCPDCDKKFEKKSELSNHRRVHTGEMFACSFPKCPRSYFALKNLNFHIKTFHEGMLKYSCDVSDCQKKFSSLRKMQHHKRKHGRNMSETKKRGWANSKRKLVVERITGVNREAVESIVTQSGSEFEVEITLEKRGDSNHIEHDMNSENEVIDDDQPMSLTNSLNTSREDAEGTHAENLSKDMLDEVIILRATSPALNIQGTGHLDILSVENPCDISSCSPVNSQDTKHHNLNVSEPTQHRPDTNKSQEEASSSTVTKICPNPVEQQIMIVDDGISEEEDLKGGTSHADIEIIIEKVSHGEDKEYMQTAVPGRSEPLGIENGANYSKESSSTGAESDSPVCGDSEQDKNLLEQPTDNSTGNSFVSHAKPECVTRSSEESELLDNGVHATDHSTTTSHEIPQTNPPENQCMLDDKIDTETHSTHEPALEVTNNNNTLPPYEEVAVGPATETDGKSTNRPDAIDKISMNGNRCQYDDANVSDNDSGKVKQGVFQDSAVRDCHVRNTSKEITATEDTQHASESLSVSMATVEPDRGENESSTITIPLKSCYRIKPTPNLPTVQQNRPFRRGGFSFNSKLSDIIFKTVDSTKSTEK